MAAVKKIIAKVEVARFELTEAQIRKYYKLRDKRAFTGVYEGQKYIEFIASAEHQFDLGTGIELVVNLANIAKPYVSVMATPVAPAKRARKSAPRKPKAAPVSEVPTKDEPASEVPKTRGGKSKAE